ncbi:MAG: hypothetical protein ACTHNP_06505 [Solirubrobacterales bacterium]
MRRRIRDIGFPLLVLMALAVSGYLAASARAPDPVPDFALQASAVYRLEVGAACFAVFYLTAMALVLALDGRGFAEVGTKGLRAVQVVKAADKQQARINEDMRKSLDETNAAIRSAVKTLNRQEKQLEELQEEG